VFLSWACYSTWSPLHPCALTTQLMAGSVLLVCIQWLVLKGLPGMHGLCLYFILLVILY
jgi:hypothetical protein